MYSTNYTDTLICPAEDCRAVAKVPAREGTVAALQYALIEPAPYAMTSDDLLCAVAAERHGVGQRDLSAFRDVFFSRGQPCLRASPLTKTHGWAVHSDAGGRVALISPQSTEYTDLLGNPAVTKVKAMRNRRA